MVISPDIFEWDYKFTANAKELLEAMKYDADLLKESKLPVTFHAEKWKFILVCKHNEI